MKRQLFIILLALLANVSIAEEPYTVRDSVSTCINIRTEPNTDAEILDCLPATTEVLVLDSLPYWRQIRINNTLAWIAKRFITPIDSQPTDKSNLWLEVHFVDVGQGDAIWIHTPDDDVDGNGQFEGMNIVIDGGPNSSDDKNPLLPYLESRAHHGALIDALIVTHPHTDHYRGAETLVRHFEIDHYYDPGFPATQVGYNAFINSLTGPDSRVNHLHLGRGQFGELQWGSELSADILYSWPGDNAGLGSGSTRDNNTSIVLKLTYGDHSFLFMGDAEGKDRDDSPDAPKYVEKLLLDSGVDLSATVLKIAHHGSETSSTTPFIGAVSPEIVVIQSGRKCFRGQQIPDMSTLARYCDHNKEVEIYRTDFDDDLLSDSEAADGDHVVIKTNGLSIEVSQGEKVVCATLPVDPPFPEC